MKCVSSPPEVIRSAQNARIKKLRKYLRFPQAEETPWVAVDGWRAIREACQHGVPLQLLVLGEDSGAGATPLPAQETLVVGGRILKALSQLESETGAMAFFAKPHWSWDSLPSVLLFLDRLQDPGNLGTLMRCAAAAGQTPEFVLQHRASSPASTPRQCGHLPALSSAFPCGKARRSRCCEIGDIACWPPARAVERPVFDVAMKPPLAIAIGNEGKGLGAEVLAAAEFRTHIPVARDAPSLNAALAGAIILFELKRRSEI